MVERQVDLGGVWTWYDDRGAGEPVVLLHGGLTDSRDFEGSLDQLAEDYRVLMPERRGHGHSPDIEGPLDLDTMAMDTARFLEQVVGRAARLVGFSAGAMVGLRVAVQRPNLVSQLVLISGGFDYASMIVRPEPGTAVPEHIAARHAEVSPDAPGHVHVVGAKILDAVAADEPLSTTDLASVACPVLVMAADDDVWTLEHTTALYRELKTAELAVIPGTSHGLMQEKPALCRQLVATFFSTPSQPLAPIRRAQEGHSRWDWEHEQDQPPIESEETRPPR